MSKLAAGPLLLIGVLLLAAALRVWGLAWGLPSATHYFSYHPDESVVLGAAMGMDLFHGQLLPHFYRYGSLQLYLINFANSLAFMFGAVDITKDPAVASDQWARMYLIGRALTVGMGIGTVWAVSALGARLWGRRAGLLAALLLAVMPLHAQHAHWLTVDVPATFWGTLSLVWAARVADSPAGEEGRSRLRSVLLAGVFAGLATATKYNMALVLLPLLLACLVPRPAQKGMGRGLPGAVLGLIAFALAFLAACPGAVLESARFLADLGAETLHVSRQPGVTFAGTGNGFIYTVARNLDAGLGLPLLLLALAGVVYAAYRRERGDGLLAAFALPYYLMIGLAAVRYARYAIPLLPVLALWAGRLLADLSRVPHPAPRKAAIALGAVICAFTLADAAWLVRAMALPDPRDRALVWLNAHAPSPTPLGFAAMPWFQVPPVSPYFCLPARGAWRNPRLTPPTEAARIVYSGQDWDTSRLQAMRPPVVILSEYDYADPLRLGDRAAIQYSGILRRDYGPPVVFGDPHSPFGGARTIRGLPTQDLPHDMLYPSPTILLYQRK